MPRYTAVISRTPFGEGYEVSVPTLGTSSFADTEAEAIERARDLVLVTLEEWAGEGQTAPEEAYPPRLVAVEVDI